MAPPRLAAWTSYACFALLLQACGAESSNQRGDAAPKQPAAAQGATKGGATAPAPVASSASVAAKIAPTGVLPTTDQGAAYVNRAGVATSAFGLTTPTALDVTALSQGSEGDCGAVAGIIASAASQPALMTKNLQYIGRDSTNVDTYSLTLFVAGKWQPFIINANTPENEAQPKNKDLSQLWGPLYEKGLAAAVGGYTKLNGINTTDVMTMITGKSASQNPGDAKGAFRALDAKMPVTSVGVAKGEGYYDATTGERVQDQNSPHAVYIHDQHYYATAGYTDQTKAYVIVVNPWNQGDGDSGRFVVTAQAYAGIFWAYSYASP